MKIFFYRVFLIGILIVCCYACRRTIDREITHYQYYDVQASDTINQSYLYAVTTEEFLEYGSRVAYISIKGDTIIPFGKYGYFGTDSFCYCANVMEHPNDSTYGRLIGVNRDQKILFDIVMFDNGPEIMHEGLLRVLRNGKMGFVDQYGCVVIPCLYDFAKWFQDGKSEVTFNAIEYWDLDEHKRVESDEWFLIDKNGNRLP